MRVLDGLGANTAVQFTGGRLQVEKLGALEEPPLMKEFRALVDAIARAVYGTLDHMSRHVVRLDRIRAHWVTCCGWPDR